TSDVTRNARARDFRDAVRKGEGDAAVTSASDDGGREDVWRDLLERRGDAQDVLHGHAGRRDHVDELRTPGGQRARLVEEQDTRPRERLDRAAALDDDPSAGGSADA